MDSTENNLLLKKALVETTGVFLERAVFETLKKIRGMNVEREAQFSFQESLDGNIDIVATIYLPQRQECTVCFLIECKRVYKEYKSWIFESDSTASRADFPYVFFDGSKSPNIRYDMNYLLPSLGYNGINDYDQAINTFEFKNNGAPNHDKSDKPYVAMKHLNASLTSFANDPTKIIRLTGVQNNKILFVPLVVTTADLYLAKYDASEIVISSGSIDSNKISLIKSNCVEYIFPLPTDLRLKGGVSNTQGIQPTKRITYVVSADYIKDFCSKFINDIDMYLRNENLSNE